MPFSHWHTSMIWSMATFSVSGARDPIHQLLELGPHLSVELGGVTALLPQDLSIGGHIKNTYLDDSAGVRFGHLDIGAVVLGVDGTQVCWHDLIVSVGLEAVQVSLVAELVDHVKVLIDPLAGVGCHLDRCHPLLSVCLSKMTRIGPRICLKVPCVQI